MKTFMFVLVSAVALLFTSALARPTEENHNLKEIIDLAERYNKSLQRDSFVENVLGLAEAGCNNKFLCKVHDILEKHDNFTKRRNQEKIVRNLKYYIDGTKDNCTELLKNEPAPVRWTTVPDLLECLVKCVRMINYERVTKSNA
uniref:Uncharacterized protein n=1 Tax=Cyclopterus lumpus TaxID=8103 RepID=A0A8C2Z9E4_CYCLU